MIRLQRLELVRWGHFNGRTLDFSGSDERLHIIYGGNAAGKSTTRRAITALLFGVHPRTQDAHTYDYRDLRIGAQLLTDAGQLEVIRRKGTGRTLLGPDGQELHDDPIATSLRALSQDAYKGLFEISHESLVNGGNDLLAGHGAVGQSLFAAAAGTGRLHRLLGALDSDAATLFKPGGRNASLNVTLTAHAKSTKELADATVRPTQAQEYRRAVDATRQAIENLDEQIRERELQAGISRRLKAVKPMLARHSELTSELEGLDDPPLLDSDAGDRRLVAQRDRDEADRAIRAAQQALKHLRDTQSEQTEPDDLLSQREAITDAHGQTAAIRKAADDRRKREGQLQQEEAGLHDLLKRIKPGLNEDDLDVHLSQESTRLALHRCLENRGGVEERLRGARDRVTSARRTLGSAVDKLAGLPQAIDTAPLRAAARAASKAGPIETHAADERSREASLSSEAERRLTRLDPRPALLEELERQTVPSRETVDRAITRKREIEDAQATIERERRSLSERASELTASRAGIQAKGLAPSASALEAARERRGEDWDSVRAVLGTKTADMDERANRLERSIADADHVADSRVAQADKLAQAGALDVEDARIRSELDAVADRATEVGGHRQTLESDWLALWKSSGMAQSPPLDVAREWLDERRAICDLLDQARSAGEKADLYESTGARHRAALSKRVAEAGRAVPAEATLDELIELTEFVADELDSDAKRRQAGERHIEEARRTLVQEEDELADATTLRGHWSQEWERLRDDYGLDCDLAAEEASHTLRAIHDALAARDKVNGLRRRIDGIDRDRDAFADQVTKTCELVAQDLLLKDPDRAVVELMTRLGEAQRTREAIDQVASQIEQQEIELRNSERQLRETQGTLNAMVAAAGAVDEADLPDVERRSIRARELQREIATCEREIAEAGEESFQDLASAAAATTGEQLDADLSQYERNLKDLRDGRDQAREAAFKAREQLTRVEQSDAAGKAADEVQQHIATARELAESYAVAKLSSRLLRETIERYRAKHQSPMLARANELFPLLTCETFTRLDVDWNDAEEPILVGRDENDRRVDVEGMSDGTREQLFLALRIAAIERYVESSGPVPVIFDDVTLESDDFRAERIFQALADLAARTQVIVFTHHRHLVALAQRVVDPDRLALHDLDDGPAQLHVGGGQPAVEREAA